MVRSMLIKYLGGNTPCYKSKMHCKRLPFSLGFFGKWDNYENTYTCEYKYQIFFTLYKKIVSRARLHTHLNIYNISGGSSLYGVHE